MAKTVVGLYDDFDDVQAAIHELVENGFSRADMSLVSNGQIHGIADTIEGKENEPAAAAGEGAVLGGLAGLLMGITMLAIPGIGWVLAAGPFAVTLGGAISGGLIGALTGKGVPDPDANIYAEAIRRGGTLLSLFTTDPLADKAEQIMNRHHPVDIIQRITEWNQWDHFDEGAQPYHITQKYARSEIPPQSSPEPGIIRSYPTPDDQEV